MFYKRELKTFMGNSGCAGGGCGGRGKTQKKNFPSSPPSSFIFLEKEKETQISLPFCPLAKKRWERRGFVIQHLRQHNGRGERKKIPLVCISHFVKWLSILTPFLHTIISHLKKLFVFFLKKLFLDARTLSPFRIKDFFVFFPDVNSGNHKTFAWLLFSGHAT